MSSALFKKILVINPFGIGDVIFSMYLVEAIKKEIPEARIGFLGNERTIDLLRMNRSIDFCYEFNRDEFRSLRVSNFPAFISKALKFIQQIRKERYEAMFDLSLGREFSFVGACLGIRRRMGLDYKNRGRWLTHKIRFEGYEKKHVVDWQLELLQFLNIEPAAVPARLPLFISDKAKKEAEDFLAQSGARRGNAFFSLAPGGGKSWGLNAIYKQWAPERFAKVVNDFGRSNSAVALMLGDRGEKELLEELKKKLTVPAIVIAGQSLEMVAAFLSMSQFLLGNDGGLLHLANALGVKSVSIYGPVDETVYGPYNTDVMHEILTEAVPCRPCYQKFHFPPCEHARRCLEELSPEKVLAAMNKIS